MTKEEIINQYWEDPTDLLKSVPKMMDEYAKQQAIAFAKWVLEQGYDRIINTDIWERGGGFQVTTEQLYNLFLQS